MSGPDVPEAGWLAALASLPGAGPIRLGRLLDRASAEAAWSAVGSGATWVAEAAGSRDRAERWRAAARGTDPRELLEGLRRRGFGVVDRASPAYPVSLVEDPEPAPVLFFAGHPGATRAPMVAIVGTRRCTRYGVDIARELGMLLASSGVAVVSGLAAGIDAAAHAGAISAGGAAPVAVVAGPLDPPYPRQNAALWSEVAECGVIFTEAPLGTPADRWRFPARNRIIAGLSQVVVVVESDVRGGSLYTAAAGLDRDLPVMAVPGPIRSPASAGTNRLIADGCHPVCDLDDVLGLLELGGSFPASETTEPQVTPDDVLVLDAIGWQPTTLDQVVAHLNEDLGVVAARLEALMAEGLVVARGRWLERVAR